MLDSAKLFSAWLYQSQEQHMSVPVAQHPHQHLLLSVFFILAILMYIVSHLMYIVSHHGLNGHFSDDERGQASFYMVLAIWISTL